MKVYELHQWYVCLSTLTTSSIGHDALVPSTTVVHNFVVDTFVVVGERLYQRRVVEVGSTVRAAIVVVAVPAAIVAVVRCKGRDTWFPSDLTVGTPYTRAHQNICCTAHDTQTHHDHLDTIHTCWFTRICAYIYTYACILICIRVHAQVAYACDVDTWNVPSAAYMAANANNAMKYFAMTSDVFWN